MATVIISYDRPICDFCSSPNVVFAYLVPDIILSQWHVGSVGAFAACDICMKLIETKQQAALEKRAYDTFIERYGRVIPDELIREFVHTLHSEFWKWISLL